MLNLNIIINKHSYMYDAILYEYSYSDYNYLLKCPVMVYLVKNYI